MSDLEGGGFSIDPGLGPTLTQADRAALAGAVTPHRRHRVRHSYPTLPCATCHRAVKHTTKGPYKHTCVRPAPTTLFGWLYALVSGR